MAQYKLNLPNVDETKYQDCLATAGGDLSRTLVLLAEVMLPDANDPLYPTQVDRRICLHLSELVRWNSITVFTSSGEVYVEGDPGVLSLLVSEGHLEVPS